MDTKLLSLIQVAETRNYTAAAKKLNLTQPAITQHIKQLELDYGVKLFTRINNELSLTNEGEIVLKYAKRIYSLYNDLNRKLDDAKKYPQSLTVGITHTAESNIAPEILADYSNQNTGIHIKIISDTIRNLYEKLSNYQIDLAIIEGKITNKKFSTILLGTDSLVAVMSTKNPLSRKRIITINDLKREKLILRNFESGTTSLFTNEVEKNGLSIDEFKIYMEIDSVASIKDLVRKDLGVSILPKSACTREIKEKYLVALPIENLDMIRETSLVYVPGNIDRKILEEIVQIYRIKVPD